MAFLYNKMEMIGGTMLLIVQLQRHVWLFTTLWTGASHASLSLNISQSLLKHFFRIPSNHLILCCPLLLLPSIFANIRVFPNELSVHIRWPKYWSFSFSISTSNKYSGLISFRIDWFHLLAVQGTLSSVFSSTTIWKHQFLGALPSLWSSCDICTWLLERP